MSNIKVGIKIRPVIENEQRHDEQWISTDNNSLTCINFLHSCNYKFDYVFDKRSLNYDVYISIVKPVVESCMTGFNGTIFTYGQTSAGKNYTMMGTEKDPGIILLAIEQLFKRTDHTLKIRVGYIEIYKERVYDLFNNRKRIETDPNGTLSNDEVLVDNFEKTMEILISGSYKRKSSPHDENKLSSISHAIFRVTIESEDKHNGAIHRSYLKFVHVAGCEPLTETRSSDSVLMLKNADDSNKSLLLLNFVVKEMSQGRNNIDFCNSTLTTLLKESLSGNCNTAIICNIKSDAVEETISTLKFAEHAKNVRTTPTRNVLLNDRTGCRFSISSENNDMGLLEQRLKEKASTKVENLLLRKELDEMKAAMETRTKWFEEQLKAAEFAQQKLLLEQIDETKLFDTMRYDFEQKIKNLNTLNEGLLMRCEELQRSNEDKVLTIHKQKESYSSLKKENSKLKNKNGKLLDENQIETGIKRKIERFEDDVNKNIKKLKNELHSKIIEGEPSTLSGYKGSTKNKETESSHTITVPDHLLGCIIGTGGNIVKSIQSRTGAKLNISERNGKPKRYIRVDGTTDSVSMAIDLIEEKIKREKGKHSRNRSQ